MTQHFPKWLECWPHLPTCPKYHADPSAQMVKEEAKEGLCNMIQDRGWGQLRTVMDHREILHGTVQCHTGLLHFVPVGNTDGHDGQFTVNICSYNICVSHMQTHSMLTNQRRRLCSTLAVGRSWIGRWSHPGNMLPCWRTEASLPHWAQATGSVQLPGPAGPVMGPTGCWDTLPHQHTAYAGRRKECHQTMQQLWK